VWLALALPVATWSASREADKGVAAMEADFRTVPHAYRVMQYVMGRNVDGDTAERYGLGGLVCAVRGDRFYKGEYLRDEAEWTRLTNQVAATLDRGLKVWLFDERGYPSGGAGDWVVKQYPQYENIGVYHQMVAGRDKKPARIELPADARRFVGAAVYPRDESGVRYDRGTPAIISGNTVSTKGMVGEWVLYAFIERFVREGTHAHIVGPTFGWEQGLYPNLLDRDAVAKFIEITHDAYARRLGPDRMKRVEAFYSNEPSLKALHFAAGSRAQGEAYVPWVDSLPARFRKMHGYDLPPRMGALFAGETDACRRVRLHFYQTVGAIMAESYAGQLSRWCRKHGTMLTGHLLSEELICYHPSLYGDFFKQIQGFDLPGVDVPLIKPDMPPAGHFLGRVLLPARRAPSASNTFKR
jgi:hypothetical protein